MADLKYDITLGIQQALQSLDKFTEKIRKVNTDLDAMTSKINSFAAAGTAALVGLGASAAAFADDLADVAAANETTIASVLGLGSALQGAGGNFESVGRMLQSVSNNMETANSGNLKMVSTFEKLGVSISDLGQLSQDEIRNKMIKNLAEMTDVTERNALAQQMFGKAALGINWKQAAADIDANTQKYQQYEESLKTAGDAFDNMASLMKDIKIAAAEAFEPLFNYIAKLKIDIPTLTTLIKVFAAALAIAVSASVLAGFAKLLVLLKDIGMVVSKNKLVAIVGTLLSIGVGIATWTGLMKDTEEAINETAKAQDDVNEKTDKAKRDQLGIADAIKKQKDALSQVSEQYNRQIKNIQDKLKFENDSIFLSEEQQRLKQEQNAIEQQTLNSLATLKQKYDSMDIDARKRVQAEYEKEKQAITETGEAAKRSVEQQIKDTQRLQMVYKDLTASSNNWADVSQKIFEAYAKEDITAINSLNDRIMMEAKLTEITKIRATLMAATAGLSDKEKAKAIEAIMGATDRTDLLKKSYREINDDIEEYIRIQGRYGQITEETANKVLDSTQAQRQSINESAEVMANRTAQMSQQSRTFSSGWAKAFREYADNADNAAQAAARIFQQATQGMEDMIVGFVKTGKLEWKGFVNSMLEELLRSQIRQVMSQILSFQGGTGQGNGGGFFKAIGGLLGFANGGIIPSNEPVIVGERGPELLMGASGRQVVPNSQLGSTQNVTYNINAVDASSFKSMVAADPSFIHAVAMQGSKATPGRR